MYYRLNEEGLEHLEKIRKILPIKYEIYGEFISVENLFNMLFDLYDEYINFVEYCDKTK